MPDTNPRAADDGGANPEQGGCAFPAYRNHDDPGLSTRQYAAIHLCVPSSGTPWLDAMIREALRDRIATAALQGLLAADGAVSEGGSTQQWHFTNSASSAEKVARIMADALLARKAASGE